MLCAHPRITTNTVEGALSVLVVQQSERRSGKVQRVQESKVRNLARALDQILSMYAGTVTRPINIPLDHTKLHVSKSEIATMTI